MTITKEQLNFSKQLVAVSTDSDNVIITVHWRYCAELNGVLAKTYYDTDVPNEGTFIPYDDLTEEIILSWVEDDTKEPEWQERAVFEYNNLMPVVESETIDRSSLQVKSWL